jgi:flavin-dependent dehydrogenase
VRLFDHAHPREKPCGGGVTGRALALVSGAVPRERFDGVPIASGVFEDPRTAPSWVVLEQRRRSPDASLLVVSRRTFDGRLLEAAQEAGAIHHAERVLDVHVEESAAHVRTAAGEYCADWIVGADGANSLVRRRLQRAFRRDQLAMACGVYAHGRTDTSIVVRFVPQPPGYIWSFPRPDHLAIGIGAPAMSARASELRAVFDAWLAGSGLADGARLERYAWPIPSLSPRDFATETPAGARYLLAGDAAGLVDPITGEGIYFALLSGQFAADAIGGSGDAVASYVGALRTHVYTELAHAARLKHGFFQGPFTRLLVDALRQSAGVREVMADLVAGVQPYRNLKARLLRTFEWRLAWQLVRLELGWTAEAALGSG